MKKYNVAIVGATGAVGQEFLLVLEQRKFPIGELRLLATERSAGKKIQFMGTEYTVQATTADSFAGIDIALFAGGAASKQYARDAVKSGAVVIDNSSAFRMDPEVPLIVPEVNGADAKNHKGIIANPNCSTIQMVVALKPIHDYAKIKRVVVSTYQAVSGAGREAIDELTNQSKAFLAGEEVVSEILPSASAPKHYQIAFNLLPQIDVFDEMDYTKEEWKMVHETKKIMGDDSIAVTATTIRVPVYRAHSESINIETEKKITAEKAKELFKNAPGVVLMDDPSQMIYPMPLDIAGKDEVYVGRIREDNTLENGLNIWVVADQIRKGAALNAVQIAEYMIENNIL